MQPLTYIYTLHDPRTREVRYVGKTVDTPYNRMRGHIRAARANVGPSNHRYNWIRTLLSSGEEPVVSVVEKVYGEEWEEREKFWIRYYRQRASLTNHSVGGEKGALGVKVSEETRQRMREAARTRPHRKHSEQTKLKMSAAQKGKPRQKHTSESRSKISKSLKGRPCPEAALQALIERNTGHVMPEETKRKISETLRKRNQERKGGIRND